MYKNWNGEALPIKSIKRVTWDGKIKDQKVNASKLTGYSYALVEVENQENRLLAVRC